MTERLTHPQGGGVGSLSRRRAGTRKTEGQAWPCWGNLERFPGAAGQNDRKRGMSQKSELGSRPQGVFHADFRTLAGR